jgi:hypothetical protein
MCLKILRFCFGTARAKLDEWECVEDRTCKNAQRAYMVTDPLLDQYVLRGSE